MDLIGQERPSGGTIVGDPVPRGASGSPVTRGGALAGGRVPTMRDPRSILVVLALSAVFALAIVVVGPQGDFPLNDDWSFAATARRLALDHEWRPLGWASMTQVTQAVLGTIVCAASSCSYEHLRAGTLMTGLALLVSTYAALVSAGQSRFRGAVGALATVFNPFVTPLLFTFMTDVPFQLMMVLAAAACGAALRTGRWRDILVATASIASAMLSRQVGLVVAVAFLPVFWMASHDRPARRAAKAATPVALCSAVLLAYEAWMRHTGRLPALYDDKYRDVAAALSSPVATLGQVTVNLLVSLLYLGLVCLPVLVVGAGRREGRGPGGRATFYAWAVTASAVLFMVSHGVTMPVLGNVLSRSGNGPLTLRDTYILERPDVPELPGGFWLLVTALSLVGLWSLVHVSVDLLAEVKRARRSRSPPDLPLRTFAVLTVMLYLLPIAVIGPSDRYIAVIAPILCLSFDARSTPPPGRGASLRTVSACGYMAALVLFSILAAHDYLAWNRARWAAIADIEASGLGDVRTVDGGFEYNGERGYRPGFAGRPGKSWWWVTDDALQLSFAPIPGTETIRLYPYRTYLPADTRFIALLRRASPGR